MNGRTKAFLILGLCFCIGIGLFCINVYKSYAQPLDSNAKTHNNDEAPVIIYQIDPILN